MTGARKPHEQVVRNAIQAAREAAALPKPPKWELLLQERAAK